MQRKIKFSKPLIKGFRFKVEGCVRLRSVFVSLKIQHFSGVSLGEGYASGAFKVPRSDCIFNLQCFDCIFNLQFSDCSFNLPCSDSYFQCAMF